MPQPEQLAVIAMAALETPDRQREVVDTTHLCWDGAGRVPFGLLVPPVDAGPHKGDILAVNMLLVRPFVLYAERAAVAGATQRRQDAVKVGLTLTQRRWPKLALRTNGVFQVAVNDIGRQPLAGARHLGRRVAELPQVAGVQKDFDMRRVAGFENAQQRAGIVRDRAAVLQAQEHVAGGRLVCHCPQPGDDPLDGGVPVESRPWASRP